MSVRALSSALLLLQLLVLSSSVWASSAEMMEDSCAVPPPSGDPYFGISEMCPAPWSGCGGHANVVEGNEATLSAAIKALSKKEGDYAVALFFYASWCPFSRASRSTFDVLSSLFPTMRHFALEQSVLKASTLAKYHVNGFPSIVLVNSTVRVRYRGPRTVESLNLFYNVVTGISPASPQSFAPEDRTNNSSADERGNQFFSLAAFRIKFMKQDRYLVPAAVFLMLRAMCVLVPKMWSCGRVVWGRHVTRLANFRAHVVQAIGTGRVPNARGAICTAKR